MRKNGKYDILYTTELNEALSFGSNIQKESGIIGGVVILTGDKVSKNKTLYTKKALEEAVKRYDGAKMYLDHPEPNNHSSRSVRDFGGTYKNLRIEEGRFLKADLHLLPNNGIRDIVMPIAEAKPNGVGLSIRDRGKGQEKDGIFLVEGFVPGRGYSIDLVTEASVNENLFESEGGEDDMKIEDVELKHLVEGNPSLLESIRNDERKKVTSEFEEKLKKGEDAQKMLEHGKKLMALAESGLASDVIEKVKKIIEPDTITLEVAESIIKSQKEICESIAERQASNGEPKVKGHGTSMNESDHNELPDDTKLIEGLTV